MVKPLLDFCYYLVTKSCPTLCDPHGLSKSSLSGSSIHGIFQQEYWSELPFPSPGDLSDPGIESASAAFQADSLLLNTRKARPIVWTQSIWLIHSPTDDICVISTYWLLCIVLLWTHSSVPAWRIPGTGEPGGLPSMGLYRVGHDWSDLAAARCSGSFQ